MKLCKVMLIAAAGAALALWLKEHVTITFDCCAEMGEPVEECCCGSCECGETETAEA